MYHFFSVFFVGALRLGTEDGTTLPSLVADTHEPLGLDGDRCFWGEGGSFGKGETSTRDPKHQFLASIHVSFRGCFSLQKILDMETEKMVSSSRGYWELETSHPFLSGEDVFFPNFCDVFKKWKPDGIL